MTRMHSRKIVVKPETNLERDLFLELAAPMISEIGVKINSSLNRIEMELLGEYDQVDRLIGQLRSLENMIYAASHPDKQGLFYYHADLLSRLYKPPANLDLYASGLAVFGYRTETESEQLKSTAPLNEVRQLHRRIIDLRQQLDLELNRDVERFVIGLGLEMEDRGLQQIVDTAISHEVLVMTEYGYQFGMDPARGRTVVLENLGIAVPDEVGLDQEFSLASFGFDGGKIVFLKDGQEVDQDNLEFDQDQS